MHASDLGYMQIDDPLVPNTICQQKRMRRVYGANNDRSGKAEATDKPDALSLSGDAKRTDTSSY